MTVANHENKDIEAKQRPRHASLHSAGVYYTPKSKTFYPEI